MAQTQSSSSTDKAAKGSHVTQSKFFCATEEGELVYADWFTEKTGEEKGMYI